MSSPTFKINLPTPAQPARRSIGVNILDRFRISPNSPISNLRCKIYQFLNQFDIFRAASLAKAFVLKGESEWLAKKFEAQ